jgi:hypothetical protein
LKSNPLPSTICEFPSEFVPLRESIQEGEGCKLGTGTEAGSTNDAPLDLLRHIDNMIIAVCHSRHGISINTNNPSIEKNFKSILSL